MQMLNVIFLDVDGELTYSKYENAKTANIDVEKVKILKQIADENDADIVISSSWRGSEKYTPLIYGTLITILKEYGLNVLGDCPYLPSKILGYIPKQEFDYNKEYKLEYGTGRAAEVAKFIKDNNVDTFLILDDEDWQWSDYGLEDKWIRPTWYEDGGLKLEHIKQAKEIFNNQKRKPNM